MCEPLKHLMQASWTELALLVVDVWDRLKSRTCEYFLADLHFWKLLKSTSFLKRLKPKKKSRWSSAHLQKCESPLENFHMVSTYPLLICTRFLNYQVWRSRFLVYFELDFCRPHRQYRLTGGEGLSLAKFSYRYLVDLALHLLLILKLILVSGHSFTPNTQLT